MDFRRAFPWPRSFALDEHSLNSLPAPLLAASVASSPQLKGRPFSQPLHMSTPPVWQPIPRLELVFPMFRWHAFGSGLKGERASFQPKACSVSYFEFTLHSGTGRAPHSAPPSFLFRLAASVSLSSLNGHRGVLRLTTLRFSRQSASSKRP